MSGIQLQSVGKIYPNGFQAIHGVDLEIHDGEFMVLSGHPVAQNQRYCA